jgi:N utilization substance protein A
MAKKKKALKKKPAAKRKSVAKKKIVRAKRKQVRRPKKAVQRKILGRASTLGIATPPYRKGLGPSAAGQSGDVQGLSESENVDSESVSELAEEGQDYEAEVVSGIESAPDADQGEVKTHEVPEDDVPPEYRERE